MNPQIISVIIPVYNVEKYLDRCMDSVTCQSYKYLEIILVDDGTKDSSGEICDKWARKDSRVKVIHKVNGGLGSARNAGLKIATGEYIAFVDSDDFLVLSIYQDCIDQLTKYNADICCFGNASVYLDGTVRPTPSRFPDILKNREEIRKEIMPKCYGRYSRDEFDLGTAWMGVYRRELFQKNNIEFAREQELICEDYVFTADICHAADSMTFVNKAGYMYCENESSLSHSYREDRFEKTVRFYENRVEDIRKKQLGKECLERAGVRYWDMTFGCLFQEIQNPFLNKQQKRRRIEEICNCPLKDEIYTDDVLKHLCIDKKLLAGLISKGYRNSVYSLASASAEMRRRMR